MAKSTPLTTFSLTHLSITWLLMMMTTGPARNLDEGGGEGEGEDVRRGLGRERGGEGRHMLGGVREREGRGDKAV